MKLIAGIDIGGTRIRCALAKKDNPQDICFRSSASTPQRGPGVVLDVATGLIRQGLDTSDQLCAAGCVAPGMTDPEAGMILEAANLSGWRNVPLRALLESKTGIPTVIENDVNAAAIAEAALSISPVGSPMVYMTVSTGIAAGILVDGNVLRGANHSAGEIGKMVPAPEHLGRLWKPGGCMESLAGGIGLAAQWARIQNGPSDPARTVEVYQAADAGNPDAKKLVTAATNYIAQATVGLASVLDPAIIILSGSIGLARPEIIERMRQELANSILYPPRVRLSDLGGDAPLLGALVLADFLADGLDAGLEEDLDDPLVDGLGDFSSGL